jgi:transcriptional regulator with XRE-family HTH domain
MRDTSAADTPDQDNDKATFAERLRAAIEEKGWTLSETARQASKLIGPDAKFGRAHIWHYLNARALPRARHLEALSRALGLHPRELLAPNRPREDEAGEPSSAASRGDKGIGLDGASVASVQDLGDSTALLEIHQRVPWAVALKVMSILKDTAPEPDPGAGESYDTRLHPASDRGADRSMSET